MSRRSLPRIDPADLRDHADEPRIARVWERIEHDLAGLEAAPPRRPSFVAMAAAAAFLAFGVGVFAGKLVWRGPPAAAIAAFPTRDRVVVDVLAAGSQKRTFPLPGGGEIALEPGTTVEVERTGGDAVMLRFLQGEAAVDTTRVGRIAALTIVADEATLNTQAGSALSVRRDADGLDVNVTDGSVNLTSPAGSQKLERGQQANDVPTHRVVSASDDPPRQQRRELHPRLGRRRVAEQPAAVAAAGWRAMKDTDPSGAFAALKADPGIDSAIDGAVTASELMEIRDVVLRGGDTGAAIRALKRVVNDFADDPNVVVAAVGLASLGQGGEARKGFDHYLSQQPGGIQADNALCGLLRLEPNKGEAARRAKDYMARHPDGHCKLDAERILQESGDEAAVPAGVPSGVAAPPPRGDDAREPPRAP